MKQYLLKVWMTAALSLLALGGAWGQESYTLGYPNVSDITHESAKLNVWASVGGASFGPPTWTPIPEYYSCYVVLPSNQKPPTISQVLSGEDSNSVPVGINFQGKIGLMSSDYEFFGSISGLAADTEYVVYLVTTEDDFQTVVIETTEPTSVSFSTITGPTPLTADLSPLDDALNVPVSTSTFEITFSENVVLAGGNVLVELYQSGTVVGSTGLYPSNISNNVVSLSFNHTLEYEKEYEIVFPANAIKSDATGVLFPGLSAGEWSFTTEAAPFTLDLQVPENGASDVALNASLVATFNQNIKLGTSAAVHIYDYQSELLVETITTGLSVSGSELTIDPTTDLTEGTYYYVVIPNGAVETTSGAPFAGLSDKDAWDFTTVYLPLENPVLSPAHNDDGVLKDVVLSLEFDKDIELGSGNIEIYSDGVEVRVLTKNSSSVSIVNNNTLQIDLSNNPLPEYETVYDVRIASTLIKRVGSDVYFVGFDAGEWSFTTEVQPDPVLMTTSSLSPADGDVEVSRAPTLQVSFDQEITWGPSGVLTIRRSDNDATAATISREQTGASISQKQLSIVFSSESLEYGTEYYVIIGEGFVKALNTSAVFAGLSDKNVWTFTTETAPPFWEEGYPMIANQTAAVFDLLGKVDQDGTYYFVVSDDDAMLTYKEISTAATSGGTGGFLAAGNGVVADNEFKATISTDDLDPGDNYYLFVYTFNGDKNGEIVRLTIDRTAPKLLTRGTFPSAEYSVLPIDAHIVLTFSEKIYGVGEGGLVELTTVNAGSFIELVTGETSVTTEISVSEYGRVFTLSPTDDLSENTSYSVEFSELSDAQFNVATIPAHTFSTDGLNEWTGLGATVNWSDAGNWYGGYAAGKSVIIPSNSLGNYPVISADVEVNNLTIDAGAVLTHNGGVLTVLGEFILKSSVDVNASYINSGAKGVDIVVDGDKVHVEQVINDVYMTYLISAPTDGTTVTNFGGHFPLYLFDNTTDTWPAVTSSHQMQAGFGYRMWTDDPLVYFSGEFNTGRDKVPLSYTSGKGYGWNLVGNPYSASIDWTLLNVIENSQNIENNFWIWMPTG